MEALSEREALWRALHKVRALTFVASSRQATGWNGSGRGVVQVEAPAPDSLVFRESGQWTPTTGGELRFHNAYRWSVSDDGGVGLEHLRFGEGHPVYLFAMAVQSPKMWKSVTGHACKDDCYTATLAFDDDCIVLDWAVLGPRKDERIHYEYRYDQALAPRAGEAGGPVPCSP